MPEPDLSEEKLYEDDDGRSISDTDSVCCVCCCGCVEIVESPYCACAPMCRLKKETKKEETRKFNSEIRETRRTNVTRDIEEYEEQEEETVSNEYTTRTRFDDRQHLAVREQDIGSAEEDETDSETETTSEDSVGHKIQQQASDRHQYDTQRNVYKREYVYRNLEHMENQRTRSVPVRSSTFRSHTRVRDVGTQTRLPRQMVVYNPRVLSDPLVERRRQERIDKYETYVYDTLSGEMFRLKPKNVDEVPDTDSSIDTYSYGEQKYFTRKNYVTFVENRMTDRRPELRNVGVQMRTENHVSGDKRPKTVVRDVQIQTGISYVRRRQFYKSMYTSPLIEKVWLNQVPLQKQRIIYDIPKQFSYVRRVLIQNEPIPKEVSNNETSSVSEYEPHQPEVIVPISKNTEYVTGYRKGWVERAVTPSSETSLEVIPYTTEIRMENWEDPDETHPESEPIPSGREVGVGPEPQMIEADIDRPPTPKIQKRKPFKKPPQPDAFVRVGGGWMKKEHHGIQHRYCTKSMAFTGDGLPFVKSSFTYHRDKNPTAKDKPRKRTLRYASFI